MRAIRPTFGSARVRVMSIAYYCDVGNVNSPVIPLGVMADIGVASVYGLGLRARTSLSNDELSRVGNLMRDRIQKPFEMLKKEFLGLWEKEDRDAFLDMPARFMGALRFEMLPRNHTALKLPRQLAMRDAAPSDAIAQWAKDSVSGVCKSSYWNLVEEHETKASLTVQDEEKIAA